MLYTWAKGCDCLTPACPGPGGSSHAHSAAGPVRQPGGTQAPRNQAARRGEKYRRKEGDAQALCVPLPKYFSFLFPLSEALPSPQLCGEAWVPVTAAELRRPHHSWGSTCKGVLDTEPSFFSEAFEWHHQLPQACRGVGLGPQTCSTLALCPGLVPSAVHRQHGTVERLRGI